MALTPKKVGGLDMAFGGNTSDLLPAMKDIPDEFKNYSHRWVNVVERWFFSGIKGAVWTPKPGIDTTDALRHVAACLGSYEPRHEHKTAGCAYLLSEFFEDVKLPETR